MIIKSIDLISIKIPLNNPFTTALRSTNEVEDQVIIVHDDHNNVGFGSTTHVTAVTGCKKNELINELIYIKKNLVNKNISDIKALNYEISLFKIKISNNALNAIIMAAYDLFSKQEKIPLHQYLIKKKYYPKTIRSAITISLAEPQIMHEKSLHWEQQGFSTIKLKLGTNPSNDLKIVSLISSTLTKPNTEIIIDFNQAYNTKQALEFIEKLSLIDHKVKLIEQPNAKHDLYGLQKIKQNSMIPIIADEACFDIADLKKIIELSACDGINIKLIKCGGLFNALSMYEMAKKNNFLIMLGCMLECPIGISAAANFAAVIENLKYVDLDPLLLIKYNPIIGGVTITADTIHLNQTPGLGLKIKGFI